MNQQHTVETNGSTVKVQVQVEIDVTHPIEELNVERLSGVTRNVHGAERRSIPEMNRQRQDSLDSIASLHGSHRMPQDLQTYIVRKASQCSDLSSCHTEASQTQVRPLRMLTRTQVFTLVSICFTTVCSASFYSLLAPFFSTEALAKGATQTEVGFIFGIFQGVVFLMSPIYGRYMVQIGPKFMYVCGILVASSCAILFGTLEWCPGGRLYVFMCFAVRSLEAVAAAATSTAALAIAAHTFPDNLSKVMGLVEICSSIGLMLGPPLGGMLFSAGGFHLPFYVTGAGFMLGGLLSLAIMPPIQGEHRERDRVSHWGLLKLPIIFIVGYMVFIGQASIGFFDVGLADQLGHVKPGISKLIVGVIFIVPSVSVIILAPINGYLVDMNRGLGKPIIILGSSVGALGVMFLGPSPLMPYLPQHEIWVPIVALALAGMGLSCLMVTYQAFVGAALDAGYIITLEMQGIISGTYNAFNSLGALLGPTLGGVMLQHLSFQWCSTVFGFAVGWAAIMLLLYTLVTSMRCPCKKTQQEDEVNIIN